MINREKFHSIEAVGILACFCGVIMMAMSEDSSGIDGNQDGSWGDLARVIGVLVMVFVAFNDGLTFVMARTMKSIHFSVLMFWFSAIGMVVLLFYMGIHTLYTQQAPTIMGYDLDQMKNLILTGVFSALNLTCITIAYQSDKSSTVSLLAYISLVYAFMADTVIFGHNFVFLELAGALLITSFNLFTIAYKMYYNLDEAEDK